jgi:uncharacterized membrane protein YoaK (UPF0700 family)
MNLKLKAALFTVSMVFFMFVGAVIANVAIDTFGGMAVVYFAGVMFLAWAMYTLYSIKLSELETLEKLNANR